MTEILLSLGGLSVFTLSFFMVVAYLWYCFVIYKKGLEFRYGGETLLDFCIISGVFGWVGARIGYVVENWQIFRVNLVRVILLPDYPGYSYLGLLVGLILVVIILSKREEIKAYEGLDLVSLGLPGAMAIERLGRVFSGEVHLLFKMPIELFQTLVFLLIFVWLWRLEKEYRTFGWYRFRRTQARPGFIFACFLFLFGLVVIIFNLWPVFSARSLALGFSNLLLGGMVVYIRSGRSLAHDVKLIPIVNRWYTSSK